MSLNELVLDTWAAISHKRAISGQATKGWLAPTWVGEHSRRLAAYRVLQAYMDNVGRFFAHEPDEGKRQNRREYGDAALLVEVCRGKVLGEDVELVVEHAADDLADDATPEEQAAQAAALERQDWLRDWARDERLRLKMTEVERDAIGLGDGVYVVGWSSRRQRPRLRLFDPGFYFPVLSDGDEDDYPPSVHIAWELPRERDKPVRIRRITYRLVPTGEERRLPWHGPDDAPATITCLLSDGVFTLRGDDRDVDALNEGSADWLLNEDGQQIRDLDLGIDFIPVVHVPNTVSIKEHYGRSLLLSVAQILDDLHAADTDMAGAAATTGTPPIALAGTLVQQGDNGKRTVATYGPGQMYQLGDNGKMDVLDTSMGLRALGDYVGQLLDRLSVNSRFPQEVLGRVTSAEAASGFAMALGFGPLQGLIDDMRLVRDEKYRLLFKFVQRLAVQGGTLPAGPALPAWLAFGSYLPSDLPGVVESVTKLLTAKAVSRATAVRMLVDAGVPVDDAQAEVEAIQAEDYAAAVALLEATGDEQAVRDYLGIQGEAPALPPEGLPIGG